MRGIRVVHQNQLDFSGLQPNFEGLPLGQRRWGREIPKLLDRGVGIEHNAALHTNVTEKEVEG